MIHTKQRALILAAVHGADTHPTADEVFRAVRAELPMISLATVYRNLHYLADEGLIRRLPMPGSPERFDRTMEPHEHLICERCGAVVDFRLPVDLTALVAQAVEVPVSGYALAVRGTCAACAAQSVTEAPSQSDSFPEI